jgi:hypothetical protein
MVDLATLEERSREIKRARSPQVTACCGYVDTKAVKWNPWNGVVQCHNCGCIYLPVPPRPVSEGA